MPNVLKAKNNFVFFNKKIGGKVVLQKYVW